jgi:hypothetical protein
MNPAIYPVLVILGGAIAVTWLGGVVVGKFIAPYADQLQAALEKSEVPDRKRGFADGGKVIGWLERFLIYLFVLSGQLAGVGFLVAAKSVFRFGELKEHHNRLEAEYITIGTLMSFSWGQAASLITRLVLDAV